VKVALSRVKVTVDVPAVKVPAEASQLAPAVIVFAPASRVPRILTS
jgi:hypothetical protein